LAGRRDERGDAGLDVINDRLAVLVHEGAGGLDAIHLVRGSPQPLL
jgi:hypothetical protein